MRPQSANERLCTAFRRLLTHGFYVVDSDGVIADGPDHQRALAETKSWRGEVWKAFQELEDRLCPVLAFEKGRA